MLDSSASSARQAGHLRTDREETRCVGKKHIRLRLMYNNAPTVKTIV